MLYEPPDIFLTRVTMELARRARDFVRPRIKSKVLARSLRIGKSRGSARRKSHIGFVEIPHYWAVYYHDGHGPIKAPPGKYIVYFRQGKKHLDPRMQVGTWYPVRSHQAKRLTKGQFYAALERGDIVVTTHSGPAKGQHFFTRGMRGFIRQADVYMATEVKKWITSVACLGTKAERSGTARATLSW